MNKIIIVVEGGRVENVFSNSNEQLDCEILDYDIGKIDEDTSEYNDCIIRELSEDENYKKIY